MQKRTIREWYKLLKEPYCSQAIANCKVLENTEDSLFHALTGGFVFNESPEGIYYWYDVCNSCDKNPEKYLKEKNNIDNYEIF